MAVSDDQGASAAAASSEEVTPTVEETPAEDAGQEPEAEPEEDGEEQGENQCTCGAAEGEAHEKGCPLYVKPEQPATQAEEALYQQFMATKTKEEADALYNGLSQAEVTALRTWLEENDKLTALGGTPPRHHPGRGTGDHAHRQLHQGRPHAGRTGTEGADDVRCR